MTEDIEREPCPHCGEPAALTGRVCPHCFGSLLENVVLDTAPADPRVRYQLARRLASLDPPPTAFLAAQKALETPPAVLATAVTRDVAQRVLALAQEHGGRGHRVGTEEPPVVPAVSFKGRALPALVALGCLFAVATGIGVYVRWARRDVSPLTTVEVAARTTPATVMLRCSGSLGSGFFVREDVVMTNAHVLCDPGDTMHAVFSSGREIAAQVLQRNDWLDLALVRVPDSRVAPLPLGDATALHTGDPVIFIGTPKGLDFTVHEGIISNMERKHLGVSYLQIDANVNGGNSGGPLLDHQGRVVGIVSAKINQSEGLGLALPVNYAYEVEPALVTPPFPVPDRAAWKALMGRVAEEDRREVAKASEEGEVADITWTHSWRGLEGLDLVLVRQGSGVVPKAAAVSVTFHSKNGQVLCKQTAISYGWHPMRSGGSERIRQPNSHYREWLQKNDLQIFVGTAHFDMQGCPVEVLTAEMSLDGGLWGAMVE